LKHRKNPISELKKLNHWYVRNLNLVLRHSLEKCSF